MLTLCLVIWFAGALTAFAWIADTYELRSWPQAPLWLAAAAAWPFVAGALLLATLWDLATGAVRRRAE